MADAGPSKRSARKRAFGARKVGRTKQVDRVKERKWDRTVKEIARVTAQYVDLEVVDPETIDSFSALPLSPPTLSGLSDGGYSVPTEIQRSAIPLALRGLDVLGAAKTGSGKTLAFLIPVLELLWRQRWSSMDGLGALVISPTRELAYQTFEVLRQVGRRHDISAGLVIGGKDLCEEQACIQRTSVVVCTPGRLLQHMDETHNFDCSSLQILVLDEADRILDLGFEKAMNAIIDNLPPDRQTLLFSATQTKSVRDLARLSLKDPQYVAVHQHAPSATPSQLTQSYIVCPLPQKVDVLYSFLRNHLKAKTIVFMSSCKQVKFVYEAFRRLRPGVPLMALYGKQKQLRRMAIYSDFCQKNAAVLFATDIAARGLDFPAVHWVVQLDCPEDAHTYIHRVGRTARYEKEGQALLFLLPSEEAGMLKALEGKRVAVKRIEVNPRKLQSVQHRLETFCAQDPVMKHWAQRSLVSYVRSVFLQSNKEVFDVSALPIDEYSLSLGLSQPPRVRFMKKAKKAFGPAEGRVSEGESGDDGGASDMTDDSDGGGDSKMTDDSDSDNDDVLTLKRVHAAEKVEVDSPVPSSPPGEAGGDDGEPGATGRRKKGKTKVASTKKIIRKGIQLNQHVRFDGEGQPVEEDAPPTEEVPPLSLDPLEEGGGGVEGDDIGGIDLHEARVLLRSRATADRQRERERVRAKHKQRSRKLRELRKANSDGVPAGMSLAAGGEEAGDDTGDSGSEEEAPVIKKPRPHNVRPTKLQEDEDLVLQLLRSGV